jgi:actin-related protein
MNNQVYQENGFSNREEYLTDLAEQYDVPKFEVFMIASVLGKSEDFDGLVTTLEDYSMSGSLLTL